LEELQKIEKMQNSNGEDELNNSWRKDREYHLAVKTEN